MNELAIPQRARDPFVRRVGDGRPVHGSPALAVATFTWLRAPATYAMTTVAKATFSIKHGEPALLLPETQPLSGAVTTGPHPLSSIRQPDDFVPLKRAADVVLYGDACAPRGRARAMEVQFRFGHRALRFERSLMVFGDRRWHTRGGVTLAPTAPQFFTRMPLVYERSFGGPTHPVNPVGLGYPAPYDLAAAGAALLPNIEDPQDLIESSNDEPGCVGFAAISPWWPERQALLGQFGAGWMRDAWPALPFDTDAGYFQCAPRRQQLERLDGDEPFELVGLHPQQPRICGTLPGMRALCFARHGDGSLQELAMNLDTVVFDLEHERLMLCWRSVCAARDADASNVHDMIGVLARLDEAAERGRQVHASYAIAPAGYPGVPMPDYSGASAACYLPLAEEERRPIDTVRSARALQALTLGKQLPRDLRAVDLAGVDLSGQDLSWVDLEHARLAGCKLVGASLEGARLAGADLRGCDLSGANLKEVLAQDCDLRDADLRCANLDAADLRRACASRARFDGCSGAHLTLEEANLVDATFAAASLPSCQLLRCLIDRCHFDNAKLPSICLYQARGVEAEFANAHMPGARMDEADLQRGNFNGIHAPGSFWTDTVLARARFDGANLTDAQLLRSQAHAAHFVGAAMRGARLGFTQLEGASLRGADLMNADLDDACLKSADLRGANLYGCTTMRCDLTGARMDAGALTNTAAVRSAENGST